MPFISDSAGDVKEKRQLHFEAGRPTGLRAHRGDQEVQVIVDDGSLAFSINGEPPFHAISGLPAMLRPYVRVNRPLSNGRAVSFTRPHLLLDAGHD